jgi:carbon monoxide dehydrogenase subunit G
MEFSNAFSVDVPLDRVWALLLDAEQVAPCVPGAQLTESIDALHHRGLVKVKLGAVQMTYRGELEMQPDETSRTIVLKARGSESRGGGGASGTFTTTLTMADGGGTNVDIHTRVDVTGRVAQFGRGIMQDVANRMIKDFAACLQRKVTDTGGDTAGASATAPAPASSADEAAFQGVDQTAAPAALEPVSVSVEPTSAPKKADPAPAKPSVQAAPAPQTELRVGRLIVDITRSRVASGLRLLARIIEP